MALQLADLPPRPLNGHFLGDTLDKVQHSFRPLTAPRNEQKSSAIISKIPQDMFAMSPAPKLQSFHRRKFRAIPCLAAEDAHTFSLIKTSTIYSLWSQLPQGQPFAIF